MRQLADASAENCRNLTKEALKADYDRFRGELDQKYGRPAGENDYFKEELERRQSRHQAYVDEIARRKAEGEIANSPPREYDTTCRAATKIPSMSEISQNINNQSGETSAAGALNNTANPSGESSNSQPSALINPTNSREEDVNPSPRLGFWQTILGVGSPTPNQNEDNPRGETSTSNNNNEEEGTNTNEDNSSQEKKLKEVQGSNAESSKRKLEEEGESSSQPSKKFKQDSSDIQSDTEPFDIGGGDD